MPISAKKQQEKTSSSSKKFPTSQIMENRQVIRYSGEYKKQVLELNRLALLHSGDVKTN